MGIENKELFAGKNDPTIEAQLPEFCHWPSWKMMLQQHHSQPEK